MEVQKDFRELLALFNKHNDVVVYYIGRVQFLSNKRAMKRKKDLADIEALGEE